jgi:hypothetical protein
MRRGVRRFDSVLLDLPPDPGSARLRSSEPAPDTMESSTTPKPLSSISRMTTD